MDHEVFISSDGESFFGWNVQFTGTERRRESRPCTYHEKDGSERSGNAHYTLESAEVCFCASPGSVRVGLRGQLSSADDMFFEVTISSLQPAQDHVVVLGGASRIFDHEKDG
jgi:hypothetical protein